MKTRPQGFGLIEIIVTIGMVSLIVISVGNLLNSINKLNTTSQAQIKVSAFLEAPIELIISMKDSLFACTVAATSTSCTVSGQTCQLLPSYTSCWVKYPKGFSGQYEFYLHKSGLSWALYSLATGAWETISSDPAYKRKIIIENAHRDYSGNISSSGTEDYDTKIITVIVHWSDRGREQEQSLKAIVTGWKNL